MRVGILVELIISTNNRHHLVSETTFRSCSFHNTTFSKCMRSAQQIPRIPFHRFTSDGSSSASQTRENQTRSRGFIKISLENGQGKKYNKPTPPHTFPRPALHFFTQYNTYYSTDRTKIIAYSGFIEPRAIDFVNHFIPDRRFCT